MTTPRLRLLGSLQVTRNGQAVELPKSQKTRALLAYLAVSGRPQSRERLCQIFWDVTDDPRGSLRWSLSKLRVLDDEGARRICADRQSVSFDPNGAFVDALEVRAAAANLHELSIDRLRELADMFRGDFLEGLDLADFDEFQAWRVAERAQFRALHLGLLRELVDRQKDDAEVALLPARELVRLVPEDESSRALLVSLLAACGRREEAEDHFNLGKKHLHKSGVDRGELREAWRRAVATPVPQPSPVALDAARQEVRFCKSADGTRIAFATLGQGRPLIKTANWMSHLEYDWKSPLWRHLARELMRDFQLVRYDQRGNGLSDWEVEGFSLEAQVEDLEAVVGALDHERFPLLGVSQGCRVAIAYAVKHPERVTHLILYGGSARGWKHRSSVLRDMRAGLQGLVREGWGRDIPAFRQVFTTLFMPDATPEQAAWFNELQRVSTSADNASRITEASGDTDVTELLAQVRTPTLVLHATRDAMVPFDEGRGLAAGIAGARFVALDSQNHLLLDDEPAFARFLVEVRELLTQPS